MKLPRYFFHRWLVFGVSLCFIGSAALSADNKPAKNTGKPTTPPPKKKAENEADEPEGPELADPKPSTEESFNVSPALLGVWKAAGDGASGPKQLTIKEHGLYTITGSETDTGYLTAMLGRYKRRPDRTKQWADGTYKMHGIDTLETDGSFGKLTWERVK